MRTTFGLREAVLLARALCLLGLAGCTARAPAGQEAIPSVSSGGLSAGETQKLLPADGAADRRFGTSVSVSGDEAVIGADSFFGYERGRAYVFARDPGGAAWTQVKGLTASDGAAGDRFGYSVSTSGGFAVVGMVSGKGAAYVFARDQGGASSWGEVKKLAPATLATDDRFGTSVAMRGDIIVVGADGDDTVPYSSGAAYVFARDQGGFGNWGLVKKLTPAGAASGDYFGGAVATSGSLIVVGAHEWNGSRSGSAYVFERDAGGADNWGQVKKLNASDAASLDYFGVSVAVDGDTVVVGSYQDDDAGISSGSAYVYARDQGGAGSWGQVRKLTASDAAAGDNFGVSVAVSGDVTLVGSYGRDAVYAYERDRGGAGSWGEAAVVTASDGAGNERFGNAVAVDGFTAIVGAFWDDDAGTQSGSAYAYDLVLGVCAPNPCQNGGTCVDGGASYSCTCVVGFEGTRCETNVDDCTPNPCQNGGTCVDGVASHTCVCAAGFTGDGCEADVDECATGAHDCSPNATCTNSAGSFACACAEGYVGDGRSCEPSDAAGSSGCGCGGGEGGWTSGLLLGGALLLRRRRPGVGQPR